MTPRILLALAGLVALAVPMPAAEPAGVVLTLVGVLALARSLARPGSTAPATVIAAAALSWLSSPAVALHDLRLVVLTLALALVHASAALAAVVPGRSHVPGTLLLRWAAWTTAATAVGLAVVEATSLLHHPSRPVPITAAALVVIGGCLALGLRAGRAHQR